MARDVHDIVGRQVHQWRAEQLAREEQHTKPRPIVTVSRELGSRGEEVAVELAEQLGYQCLDREVVEEIARKSDMRRELIDAIDQQTRSFIQGWIEGVLTGREFDEGDFCKYLLVVVHSLSRMGSVVILGRGANFVPVDRPALHVRVVAPVEQRATLVMERYACDRVRAHALMKESDSTRRRFVRRLFDKEWDDPLGYDVIINTGRVPVKRAVRTLADAVKRLEAP